MSSIDTGYLNAQDAADLDAELMSTPGFSLGKLSTYTFYLCVLYISLLTIHIFCNLHIYTEQLMELAGLSVAEAVYDVAKDIDTDDKKKKHILLVCG